MPDIGDFRDVPVIDVLVKPGDVVSLDDSLITLESDKATMDVPSPAAGKVIDLRVHTGDKVSEGSVVLTLDGADGQAQPRRTREQHGERCERDLASIGAVRDMASKQRH